MVHAKFDASLLLGVVETFECAMSAIQPGRIPDIALHDWMDHIKKLRSTLTTPRSTHKELNTPGLHKAGEETRLRSVKRVLLEGGGMELFGVVNQQEVVQA